MNGVLENLAQGIANAVAPNDPDVKILNAQAEVEKLKVEEEKIFAEIGKKVIESGNIEKYGDLKVKLDTKKEEIIKAEESLKSAKEEKEKDKVVSNENTGSHFCTNCGMENGLDVKFCRECGTKLINEEAKKLFCTNCGTENKAGTKFCVNCGNKF